MRLTIQHTTHYEFDAPVSYGLQVLRKTPRTSPDQTVHAWETLVTGGRKQVVYDDHHKNRVELLSFTPGTQTVTVTSRGEVEVANTAGIVGPHRSAVPLWLYRRPTGATKAGQGVRALVRQVGQGETLEQLHHLTQIVRDNVAYEVGASSSDASAEDAIAAGAGVCQDHTHIFVAAAREMGIPARYVSGYLKLDDRTDQDAMHAWAEAHIDPVGWVGFDVSNGISPDPRYVRVAVGLDYAEAAPVTGMRRGGAAENLSVDIAVSEQQQ